MLNQALQDVNGSVSIQNLTEYYTTNVDKRDKTKRKGARKSEKPVAQVTVEIDGRTQTIDENLFDLTPSALIRRVEEVASQIRKSTPPPQTSEPKPFG